MELAQGNERAVDGIARDGRVVLGHPKAQRRCAPGWRCTSGRSTPRPDGVGRAGRGRRSSIDHFFNVKLVGDVVIEINPRISTGVYQEDLNMPCLGLKHALGELSDDELVAALAPACRGRAAARSGTSTRSSGTSSDRSSS